MVSLPHITLMSVRDQDTGVLQSVRMLERKEVRGVGDWGS